METLRGAFTLLSLLFLATSTVHAVNYKGPSHVDEGEPWSIECTNVQPKDEIIWTRNNESLEPEILKDDLSIVTKIRALKSSSISALEARPHHAGRYKCTNNSEEAFPLFVNSGNMFRVLSNESVPLTLECGETTSKDVVRWFKEKHDLLAANTSEEFKKLQEFITVNTTTGTLVITKETDEVLGNYSCTLNGVSQEFKVVPKPTAVLPPSTTVIEGEKLHLVCNGKQTPGVKIMWTFGGKNYTKSSDRVKLSIDKDRGINGAVLTVENINMSDRGDIYCRASYDWSDPISKHHAEAKILLRVKDKLAALWPFLGICAEVVVLCAIILIYEKKRNKAELEESDTDQSPDTKPTPNKDSDVRQRK